MKEVKSKDRERMADELQRLGLYATATFVRKGKISLTHGVEHVRHYVLPGIVRAEASQLEHEAKYPPEPGTYGTLTLPNIRARHDELQAFLDDWFAYDLASPPPDPEAA